MRRDSPITAASATTDLGFVPSGSGEYTCTGGVLGTRLDVISSSLLLVVFVHVYRMLGSVCLRVLERVWDASLVRTPTPIVVFMSFSYT